MMIAYGPAEDPEIAIGIVMEYGGGGARTGDLVADIFDAYFAMKDGSLTLDETGAATGVTREPAGRMLCRRLSKTDRRRCRRHRSRRTATPSERIKRAA